MQSRTTLKRHARLVDTMAEAQGIDLEEAILRGKMSISDLDDAVLRCTGCSDPGRCERFLGAVDRMIESVPDFCRNDELFSELKHG